MSLGAKIYELGDSLYILALKICLNGCLGLHFKDFTNVSLWINVFSPLVSNLRPTDDFEIIYSLYSYRITGILQQYLDKVTLDLSKGRFFTKVFLGLYIHETKVGNDPFHHLLLGI